MILAALFSVLVSTAHPPAPKVSVAPPKPMKLALVCFKTAEETSGMNKLCYYDCAGSRAAITVGSAQLCPLSINR
jgi:hypothetical protein